MSANRFDLEMSQGETFQLYLNIQDANTNPITLTNCNALMEIRPSYISNTVSASLSTSNGEITVANNGVYLLTLSGPRTANIYVDLRNGNNPPSSMYVYDLLFTDRNNISTKIIYGNVKVNGLVSR